MHIVIDVCMMQYFMHYFLQHLLCNNYGVDCNTEKYWPDSLGNNSGILTRDYMYAVS